MPDGKSTQSVTSAGGLRHGSVAVFDELWEHSRHRPVDSLGDAKTQAQLADLVKADFLDALFPSAPGTRSLECGCGSAGISLHFGRRGYETHMLDASPKALELASRLFSEAGVEGHFLAGEVEAIPLPDSSMDVVMSFGLMEHFEDVDAVFSEMVRVIKPGGIVFADIVPRRFSVQTVANLVINNWASFAYYSWTAGISKGLREFFNVSVGRPAFYENAYPRAHYRTAMESAGLADVQIIGNNPWPTLYVPPLVEHPLVRLLKKTLRFWRKFDAAAEALPKQVLCRGWWAYGYKKVTQAR